MKRETKIWYEKKSILLTNGQRWLNSTWNIKCEQILLIWLYLKNTIFNCSNVEIILNEFLHQLQVNDLNDFFTLIVPIELFMFLPKIWLEYISSLNFGISKLFYVQLCLSGIGFIDDLKGSYPMWKKMFVDQIYSILVSIRNI